MSGQTATTEAINKDGQEVSELVDLAIGRVDGVDSPAHGRQFLLIKSADGAVIEKDEAVETVEVDHDAIATAAEKCLVALASQETPLTAIQVQAVKSLAGALGMGDDEISVVPVPATVDETGDKAKPARARKSKAAKPESKPDGAKNKGGSMVGNGKKLRKAAEAADAEEEEVDPTDDELEEMVDAVNESDDDEEDDDDPAAVADTEGDDDDEEEDEAAKPKTKQPVQAARGTGKNTSAVNHKLPTKGKVKPTVPAKASARKSATDDLDDRIAAAVSNAMAGPLEALTAAISGLQPTQKSAARPVSKQAKGQDDVQKSSGTPKIGEGLWTNIIFPE